MLSQLEKGTLRDVTVQCLLLPPWLSVDSAYASTFDTLFFLLDI